MFSINRIFFAGAVVSAVAAAVMASGCAVGGIENAEIRVATKLEGASPKMIVTGPARLLHVDVHGRQALSLYSVKRAADGGFNCAAVAGSDAVPLRQGASNELNLVVPADEAVCVANGSGIARDSEVAWHARRGAVAPPETLQASNF
jgi:hypothetical protein